VFLGVNSITHCYSDSATQPWALSSPDPVVVLASETAVVVVVVVMFVVLGAV
jgi:hypothetical protein